MLLNKHRTSNMPHKKMTPELFQAIYTEYKSQRRKETMKAVCNRYGVSRALFYFHLNRMIRELNEEGASAETNAPNDSPGQENTSTKCYPKAIGKRNDKPTQDKQNERPR